MVPRRRRLLCSPLARLRARARSPLWRSGTAAARRLEAVRPAYALAPLVVVQLLATLWLALSRPHNGWLFYHGGDATEYWSHEWAVAHGFVPRALLGYADPARLRVGARAHGRHARHGPAVIVLIQVLVLVPLTVVLVFGVASRLAGRLLGYVAVVLWIASVRRDPALRVDYRRATATSSCRRRSGSSTSATSPRSSVVIAGCLLRFCGRSSTGRLDAAAAAGSSWAGDRGQAVERALPGGAVVLLVARALRGRRSRSSSRSRRRS